MATESTRTRTAIYRPLLGAAALLAAMWAQAAAAPSFEALDKNSDGKVSLNEAAEHDALFVAFRNLDSNKDGMLTKEEFAAYQKQKPSA